MKNKTFRVVEFVDKNCEMTGRVELYLAPTIEKAVKMVHYTKRLVYGKAKIGPSKRVVYAGEFAYTIHEKK